MIKKQNIDLDYILEEIEYYTGRTASIEEAKEILWHLDHNSGTALEEIISAYYGCEGGF